MSKAILNMEYQLYEKNGQAFCSSRQIAEEFEKRHDDVLKTIRNLDCSAEFRLRNFAESSYKNEQNKKQPEYLMTKDGFVFLVMGYRGKKAAKFKEAYIRRFNEMEDFIKTLISLKNEYPEFTQAITMLHPDLKPYHITNENNMIYRIVLGVDAKKYKELNGIGDVPSIRPYLPNEQAKAIDKLIKADIGLMLAEPDYHKRKEILTQHYERLRLLQIA